MILYFSGTGNSRYAAQVIQSITGDEIVSINDLIKYKSESKIMSKQPLVFIAPTYCGRMPRIVDQFITERVFQGNQRAYFLLTCFQRVGDSGRYIQRLCRKKGFEFMGLGAVTMPQNYLAMYPILDKQAADLEVKNATPKIEDIARVIKDNGILSTDSSLTSSKMMSTVINPVFYRYMVTAKGFYSTDKCTSCGKCAQSCSLNNVKLVEGRPEWGKDCTHCMACICGCPTSAIEYKNSTQGKTRYYNQGYRK